MTTTREQAIEDAGCVFAHARADRDALSPRLAAEAAWWSGGPSIDEIERRIREMRRPVSASAAA